VSKSVTPSSGLLLLDGDDVDVSPDEDDHQHLQQVKDVSWG
jgi:hypothetical protein